MKLKQNILNRQRNPISWIYSLFFFVLFCFGVWHHDWVIIIITLLGLFFNWYFFPATNTSYGWADKCIDAGNDWLAKPFDTEKTVVTALYVIFFILLIIGLWIQLGSLVTISAILLVLTKAYTFRSLLFGFMGKKSKKTADNNAAQQSTHATHLDASASETNTTETHTATPTTKQPEYDQTSTKTPDENNHNP